MFKELIQSFFQEFFEVFFPEEYAQIEFSGVKFLEQEVFTDIVKGEKRFVDILTETKVRDEEVVIIIHIGPQSYFQKDFHERMFIYCSRLYEKYRKPILPITIFSYNDQRDVPNYFKIATPNLNILEFRYL